MKLRIAAAMLVLLFSPLLFSQASKPQPQSKKATVAKQASTGELVDRVGTTGFIQLHADSFRSLSPRQQELTYWLSQASIAIDPIIYEQLSRFGVRQKRLLEEIASHPQEVDPTALGKIEDFAKLFWANRGNHNELTSQKFTPEFTFEQLQAAALQAQKNGGFQSPYADLPALTSADDLNKELSDLKESLFDPNFEPMITAKSPEGGKDIIEASSNTFYGPGVTLSSLKDFQEKHPLNSNVVMQDGKLVEQVWRAGTPDGSVPPGVYATYLKKANEYLAKAQNVADPQQAQVIGDLIRFYQTGDFNDWLKFGQDWVGNNATVDFANGFIEVYRDARGQKGSSQSFVGITDKPLTDAMVKLASNAEYFEQHAPWADRYKKQDFTPPTVKAIETVIETGDFHITTIGDNLPNENQIREQYGTKNFLFTASSRAFDAAAGHKAIQEFGASPEVIQRSIKYGQEAEELHTAMHEVIGHGSGKLNAKFKSGTEGMLKEYYSTMEEARADLMALWNAFDPKLKELGLVSNQDEVAKAMYDSSALVVLTQLRRIPRGTTIEEDHQRNRALIANYIMETTGAIKMVDRNGKTYVKVTDYPKMHEAVGKLLAEIMRMKAEGDYDGLKALIDKYGVHFDPTLRDQVVQRYKALNTPTYWAGVNPQLNAKIANGKVLSVSMEYPKDAVRQFLYYGSMYAGDLKGPSRNTKADAKPSTRKSKTATVAPPS